MRRADLQLLRLPSFRRLWAARTISIFGSAVTPVALAFGVLDLPGAGPRELALVLTVESIASLATVLLGGVLGDRFPRTRVLMLGESIAGTAVGAIAVLFILDAATVPIIATLAAIAGGAAGTLFPILAGLVPETVPPDRLQPANALLRLSHEFAFIGGAGLAGILVATVGSGWTLAIDATSYLVSVWIVAALPKVGRQRQAGGLLSELRAGWRGFVSFPWIWATTIGATFWVAGFQSAYGVLGPTVAKDELGGAPAWGLVVSAFAVGGVLGTLIATRIRPRRPMLVVTVMFQPGALFIASLAPPMPLGVIVAMAVFTGISFSLITVLWETMLQTHVPPELLARVSSYDYLGSAGAIPIATAAAGTSAAVFGVTETLIGCAVVMVLAGLEPLLVRDVWRVGLTRTDGSADTLATGGKSP